MFGLFQKYPWFYYMPDSFLFIDIKSMIKSISLEKLEWKISNFYCTNIHRSDIC